MTQPAAVNSVPAIEHSDPDDVQGYLVVNAVIGVLIGMLLPAVQKETPRPNGFAGASSSASGTVRQ